MDAKPDASAGDGVPASSHAASTAPCQEAVSLPGMPTDAPQPDAYLTLGDLLQVVSDVMQHDVSLCTRMVKALREAENVASSPAAIERQDVYTALSAFVESQPADADSKAMRTLEQFLLVSASSKRSQELMPLAGAQGTSKTSHADIVRDCSKGSSRNADCARELHDVKRRTWFPDASNGCLRRRVFMVFDDAASSILGQIMAISLIVTIAVSTISFVMESMPEFRLRPGACEERKAANLPLTIQDCEPQPHEVFYYIEAVCIVVFSIDYIVRMCTIHAVPSDIDNPILRTLAYAREPLNVIDILAVLPFYLGLVVKGGVGVMRIMRLARILRLFKAMKHHRGLALFKDVMVMSGQPLMILLFFNVIITVLFGSLIFFAEGTQFSVDPKYTAVDAERRFPTGVFVRSVNGNPTGTLTDEVTDVTPFRSIPYSLWYVLVTMTTVGYGDYSPTTTVGKVIGVTCFYVGVIFLALPIGLIGSNFELVYQERMEHVLLEQEKKRSKKATQMSITINELALRDAGYSWLPQCGCTRRKIFILFEDPSASRVGKWVSIFVIVVILVSTTAFVLESMPDFNATPEECTEGALTVAACRPRPLSAFGHLEVICIVVFTVDYVIRVSLVHAAHPEDCGVRGLTSGCIGLKTTFLYCLQYLNIIDFIAIVPFYVEKAGGGGGGASVLRVLRLVRIFRVLKMRKLRACAEMFIEIVVESLPALALNSFMTVLMCVLFASLIVFAEGSTYSVTDFVDEFPYGVYIRPTYDGYSVEPSPFVSILSSFWWFFTTATTVGYGDEYPTTTAGRVVAMGTFYVGIVLIALPITIVGSSFNKHYPIWVKEFGDGGRDAMSTPMLSDAKDPNDALGDPPNKAWD
mmetsp:Transcript_112718/g.318549  ORF Transcript_112718/g.318549 Transcript_112718/m.318549 type:complete len:865 (-) Transcript_112718:100-2694(-)